MLYSYSAIVILELERHAGLVHERRELLAELGQHDVAVAGGEVCLPAQEEHFAATGLRALLLSLLSAHSGAIELTYRTSMHVQSA